MIYIKNTQYLFKNLLKTIQILIGFEIRLEWSKCSSDYELLHIGKCFIAKYSYTFFKVLKINEM